MFRGRTVRFLGRVTTDDDVIFWPAKLEEKRKEVQSRHPKNDLLVQNKTPKQHPRSDWNSLQCFLFSLLQPIH